MIANRIQQWRQELPEEEFRKFYADTFNAVLAFYFDAVPEWAQQKVARAETVSIDQWLEKLLCQTGVSQTGVREQYILIYEYIPLCHRCTSILMAPSVVSYIYTTRYETLTRKQF